MSDKVYYAIVRVESDKDMEEISKKIRHIENDVSALTRIDVQQVQGVTREMEEMDGGPALYWS